MNGCGPRILLIGGGYRALCVLERLIERGERIVAAIGQEGDTERDFCAEILEMCDRFSIPARSGRKFGEEMVRWLEDRIRPELAIAVGVTTEIPLAIGGNCRAGLVEVMDRLHDVGGPRVTLHQKGQPIIESPIRADVLHDPERLYTSVVEATVVAIESYLNGPQSTSGGQVAHVPFDSPEGAAALHQTAPSPDDGGVAGTRRDAVAPSGSGKAACLPRRAPLPGDEVARRARGLIHADRVLAVDSHSTAFELLAGALEIGEGDEVICPPFISSSALRGIARVGAHPVFADVCDDRLTLDPTRIEGAVGPRTRAVCISHAFGQPAELDLLYGVAEGLGLEVMEDAGTALGARLGGSAVGRSPCACAFRVPLTPLPGGPSLGLLAVPDALARRAGPVASARGASAEQAALAGAQLDRIDDHLSALRSNASHYSAELSRYDAFRVPATPEGALPIYSQYVLRVTRFARTGADDLTKLLAESGVEVRRVRPLCTERQLVLLPVTEAATVQSLLLPNWEGLSRAQLDHVLDAIFDFAIG